jgi:hypothetical protein
MKVAILCVFLLAFISSSVAEPRASGTAALLYFPLLYVKRIFCSESMDSGATTVVVHEFIKCDILPSTLW